MPQTHRVSVTRKQWDEAAADYELGHKHAAEIARELGVSAATVSREFKRRGCVKASRIAETFAAIEAQLDAEAEEKAHAEVAAEAERKELVSRLLDEFFATSDAVRKRGKNPDSDRELERIGRELSRAVSQPL
jgi:DNA-binding MurR/RpiR family transcriptional regulator